MLIDEQAFLLYQVASADPLFPSKYPFEKFIKQGGNVSETWLFEVNQASNIPPFENTEYLVLPIGIIPGLKKSKEKSLKAKIFKHMIIQFFNEEKQIQNIIRVCTLLKIEAPSEKRLNHAKQKYMANGEIPDHLFKPKKCSLRKFLLKKAKKTRSNNFKINKNM